MLDWLEEDVLDWFDDEVLVPSSVKLDTTLCSASRDFLMYEASLFRASLSVSLSEPARSTKFYNNYSEMIGL